MSTEDNVRNAGSAQEALIELAKGIDLILVDTFAPLPDPFESDIPWTKQDGPADAVDSEPFSTERARSSALLPPEDVPEEDVVDFPVVDKETQETRRRFANTQLMLTEVEGDEDLVEAYAKAGPRWLHAYNRKLVLAYPQHVRQVMVQDVDRTEPDHAKWLAADILKDTGTGKPLLGG